jgi:hypothetical protein
LAWGRGLDSTVSGQVPVAGCCECGDEPSGSCATELVIHSCETISLCRKFLEREECGGQDRM